MPILITDLNISISVNQPGSRENSPPVTPNAAGQSPQESIVEECVEQIIKILNDKKER